MKQWLQNNLGIGAVICCSIFLTFTASPSVAQTLKPSWTSLGLTRTPPLESAQLFGSGRFSTELTEHVTPSFSSDGKHAFWSFWLPQGQSIVQLSYINRRWRDPNIIMFPGHSAIDGATFHPSEEEVFFDSNLASSPREEDNWDIWKSRFSDGQWTHPERLPDEVNSDAHEVFPAVASSGNIYFMTIGTPNVYYRAEFYGDSYGYREPLPDFINEGAHYSSVYIHPDESFIIFCSDRPGGYGDGDLYVSFADDQGEWQDPINLGPRVNTERLDRFPKITPDGRALLFARHTKNNGPGYGQGDFYWIDASVVSELANSGTSEDS